MPRIIKTGKRKEQLEPNVEPFKFYVDAFKELSTCRNGGMDLMPIPFTAIVEYAKIYNISDIDEFVYLIRRMDSKLISSKDANEVGKRSQNKG